MEKVTSEKIEKILDDFNKNVDQIINCYRLMTQRLCYQVMKLYNKCPELVPCSYVIDLNELIDDDHKEFLKKNNVNAEKIEIRLKDQNSRIVRWETTIKVERLTYNWRFSGTVIVEFNKNDEIEACKASCHGSIIDRNFELIVAIPVILSIEEKIMEALLKKIYETVVPKIDAINKLMEEMKELKEIGTLTAMDT